MKKTCLAMVLISGLAGLGWWQRQPVLAWYHVRQLIYANQANCESCAKRVADLDEAALPHLLDGLQSPDALVCANMQNALMLMAKTWTQTDPRTQRLLERLNSCFESLSQAGQEKAVLLLTGMLQQDGPRPLPPRLTKVVSEILVTAEKNPDLRGVSLMLAAELVECVQPGQWVDVCRGMAERGLKDARPGPRVAALQLLRRPPMRSDKDALVQAVPLLRDPDASVRRAALVALASEAELVREEAFLPLLHDEDSQVQYLCEMALRKRGLADADINLARMISDKNPSIRMRVLLHIPHMPELNLAEWLRQLSNDPEPAVRAAAVRAASEYPGVDMTQRLQEMANRDTSASVRQNASFYLSLRLPRAAANQTIESPYAP